MILKKSDKEKNKAELDSLLAKYKKAETDLKEFTSKIQKQLTEFLLQNKLRRLDIDKFFATLFCSLKGDCYLENTMSEYLALKMKESLECFHKIHEICIKKGFIAKNEFDYNDLDNHVFAIPLILKNSKEEIKQRKIICITTQNLNFLFIWQSTLINQTLHVRRFWDKWDSKDEDRKKEALEFKKKGMNHLLAHAEWLIERWSDCVPGNKYVRRPSLEWFAKNQFELYNSDRGQYGDCRDDGYIFTYEKNDFGSIDNSKMDKVDHTWNLVTMAISELKYALDNLVE